MGEQIPTRFSPGDFLEKEMAFRGWTSRDVAMRMGERDPKSLAFNQCIVEMMLAVREDKNLLIDPKTAAALGQAFGVSPALWLNLDALWRGGQSND